MKKLLTLWLLAVAALLVSCGGGGSPYVATTDAACSLPLQFANASNSGIPIAESGDWSPGPAEVGRLMSDCPVERLQAMHLGVCLKHSSLNDLQVRISGPNQTMQTIPLSGTSAITDPACSRLDPSARLLSLSANTNTFSSLSTWNGQWLVQVRDSRTGYESGFLIGWSLGLDGVKW